MFVPPDPGPDDDRPAVPSPGTPSERCGSVGGLAGTAPRAVRPAAAVIVTCEESLHLDYCPRRRRHLWEAATFTLRAVRVAGPHGVRRYGPLDRWTETVPDPRTAYAAVGTALVRRAAPGRDYDEARHVTGLP